MVHEMFYRIFVVTAYIIQTWHGTIVELTRPKPLLAIAYIKSYYDETKQRFILRYIVYILSQKVVSPKHFFGIK